jgi:hypothetical protein
MPETWLPPDLAARAASARALAPAALALREARRQGDQSRLPDAATVERLAATGLTSGGEQQEVERRRTHARLMEAISLALEARNDGEAIALAEHLTEAGGSALSVELLVALQAARRRQSARAALEAAVDAADDGAICRAAEMCQRLGVAPDGAGEQVILSARRRRRR